MSVLGIMDKDKQMYHLGVTDIDKRKVAIWESLT